MTINIELAIQKFSFANLIIVILILGESKQNFAQNSTTKFEQFSILQGLSDNRVEAICQDSKGFMWFGTAAGLNRFDGYNFINYGHISFVTGATICEDKHGRIWLIPGKGSDLYRFDRISDKFILYPEVGHLAHHVLEDKYGDIWIATWNKGLAKYLPGKDKFVFYADKPGTNYRLPFNAIDAIYEDKNRNLWIGGPDGLYKFNRITGQFVLWNENFKKPILSIFEDRKGLLWVGTWHGLYEIDKSGSSFVLYTNKKGKPNEIRYIYEDSKNRLWVGSDQTISQFNPSLGKFIKYDFIDKSVKGPTLPLNPILEDRKGVIWTGINLLLSFFNEETQNFEIYHDNSHEGSVVCSMYRDRSGTVWFGSMKDGVYMHDGAKKLFHNVWNTALNSFLLKNKLGVSVISLYKDKAGILWIGKPDGMIRLDERKGLVKLYTHKQNDSNSLSNSGIDCIAEESPDILWLSTFVGGINRFDKSTGQSRHFMHDPKDPGSLTDNSCLSLLIDETGALWLISGGTIEKYNQAKRTFTHYRDTLNSNTISIFEDSFKTFWASTTNGVAVFDRKTGKFTYIQNDAKNSKSLINNDVNTFYEDKSGNLWVCTGSGLDKIDRKSLKLKHITQDLPNRIIGILEDDHKTLWLLTLKGISNYNTITGVIKNYGETDGISLNSAFYYPFIKDKSGQMYFGGFNGLIRFNPDSISDNPFIPPVAITSFKESNIDVNLDTIISEKKFIEIPYPENNVSFEFAALNYSLSQKNQYAYKLEGIDKDWVYSGTRRFASYPNLKPGRYTFRVKGSNNDGVWNEAGTSLVIMILPPWWKTLWAYSAYGLIFLFSLYWLRRYELNRLSFKNQVKTDEAVLKEKEETEKLKSRFFANISHEFRTPLTLILGPAEKIHSGTSDNIKKDSGVIRRNSLRLLQLVNQLLELSRLEAGKLKLEASKGNIVSFVKGVALSFESLSESKDITLKIQTRTDQIEMYFDKEKMMQILSNILSNAFKFTHEEGKITVSIRAIDQNLVEIKISDTGIGIAPEDIPKLFDRFYQVDSSLSREFEGTGIGLALTKELVELHRGKIAVTSKKADSTLPGSGWTEFSLEFPLGRAHLKAEEIKHTLEKIPESGWQFQVDLNSPPDLNSDSSIKPESGDLVTLQEDKTIVLVVEDNYDMRQYIKDSLNSEYFIEEAVNGEQGARKAQKIIPDLVISDLMMPKMDGNEMLRILKNDERTSHIPVILLTAKASHEDKLDSLETGADDYLTKPFDIKELQYRVRNLISIRKKLQEKFSKPTNKPAEVKEQKISGIDEKFMQRVNQVIDKHISEEEFDIEEFCGEVAMSRTQLHRKLKALTGKSASLYIRSVKLARAKIMIEDQQGTISEVAYSVGFSSPVYFTRCFREEFGYPPSELKK